MKNDKKTSNPLVTGKVESFFSFLNENYELNFTLPKKKPVNDVLYMEEKEKLKELMDDKDFYEINSIIKNRYKTV